MTRRLNEGPYSHYVHDAEDGFLLADAAGRVLDANPSCCWMTGLDADELAGMDLADLVAPADRSRLRAKLERLPRSGGARLEATLACGAGSSLKAELSMHYSRSQGGRIGCFIRDLARLQAAGRRRSLQTGSPGIPAGGIAHEFNNILSIMLGYSGLVLDDLPVDSRNAARLKEVLRAGIRARGLVDQMLASSQPGASSGGTVDLTAALRGALSRLAPELPPNIRLKRHIPSLKAKCRAEAGQIQEVLQHLLANSAQAMGGEGRLLEVSLSEAHGDCLGLLAEDRNEFMGPYWKITVSDTGRDIDSQSAKQVFDPFSAVGETGPGRESGLSVVHGILRSLGGLITLESEPGQGAVFEIYLPRADHEAEGLPGHARRLPEAHPSRTVLN